MADKPQSIARRRLRVIVGVAAGIGLAALAWPAAGPDVADATAGAQRFIWGRDSLWSALETSFARVACRGLRQRARRRPPRIQSIGAWRGFCEARVRQPSGTRLARGFAFFRLAPRVAACGTLANDYVALQGRLREAIKWQSTTWDLTDREVRDRLYRSLYGSRAAVEEVMLQHQDSVRTLFVGSAVPSATPSAMSNGVELHSGDILVSRGGYPTSALIARGNDYPGNFSHIAFVHVDSATHEISVIEAHIERGVVVATADQYLADKKLRVMLLRPRPDLPALQRDPMLPHRAAASMLQRARTEHIPYDFTMDYADAARLFCSEVASAAYREHGVTLWTGISTISAPGLRRWLASFGVRQFETQEPSDLEYDPQLAVVAEWRDAASLFDDHMDNAVTDAMLEGAERGDTLEFDWYALPVARLIKGYSWMRERFRRRRADPRGHGAVRGAQEPFVRLSSLGTQGHGARAAAEWRAGKGYRPPYWTLVSLAREATEGPQPPR